MSKNFPYSSTLQLGPYYEAIIAAQVRHGKYPNAAEVLKNGLRLIDQNELTREVRLAELRTLLDEADKDNRLFPSDQVREDSKQRYTVTTNSPSLTGEGWGEDAKAGAGTPSPIALWAPTSPVQGEVSVNQIQE